MGTKKLQVSLVKRSHFLKYHPIDAKTPKTRSSEVRVAISHVLSAKINFLCHPHYVYWAKKLVNFCSPSCEHLVVWRLQFCQVKTMKSDASVAIFHRNECGGGQKHDCTLLTGISGGFSGFSTLIIVGSLCDNFISLEI